MSVDDSMRAFGRVAAAMQDQVRPGRRAQARAGVLMRASRHRRRRRVAWRPVGWVGLGFATAAAAAVLLVGLRPQSSVEVTPVEPPAIAAERSHFVAPPEGSLVLHMADGSSFELQPQGRAHVASRASGRRHVVLDEGSARVDAHAGDGEGLSFEAGPYRVETDTGRLDLRWQPVAHTLIVSVVAGDATVTGPGLSSSVRVVRGERIELGPSTGRSPGAADAALSPEAVSSAADASAADAALGEPDEDDQPSSATRRSRGSSRLGGSSPRSSGWRALADQGEYRAAIEAAQAEGFDTLCRTLPADALLKLADAARYARRLALARQALGAVRRRFAGRDAAALAAFDLGRLDAHDCSRAQRWFRVYLSERPGGDLAEVAAARVEECERRSPADR